MKKMILTMIVCVLVQRMTGINLFGLMLSLLGTLYEQFGILLVTILQSI